MHKNAYNCVPVLAANYHSAIIDMNNVCAVYSDKKCQNDKILFKRHPNETATIIDLPFIPKYFRCSCIGLV